MGVSRRWDFVGLRTEASGTYDAIQWDVWDYSSATAAVAAVSVGINSVHPDNSALLCYRVAPVKVEGPTKYVIQADYGRPPNGKWNKLSDPTTAPPVVTIKYKTITVPTDTADYSEASGGPHARVNSAGDPFDPPMTKEKTTALITVTLWKKRFDPAFVLTRIGCLNEKEVVVPVFGTAGIGTLKLLSYAPVSPIDGLTHIPIDNTSLSGTFVLGETVTAGSGGGTGTLFLSTPSELTLVASSGSFVSSFLATGGTSGAHAPVTTTTFPPYVQVQIDLEYDSEGWLKKNADMGSRGFYTRSDCGGTVFPGKIMFKGSRQPAGVIRLKNGAPADQAGYIADCPTFAAWSTSTTTFTSGNTLPLPNTGTTPGTFYINSGPVAYMNYQDSKIFDFADMFKLGT